MLLYLPRLPGDQEVAFSEEAETPKQRGRLCVGRRGWAMTLTQERAEAGRGAWKEPPKLRDCRRRVSGQAGLSGDSTGSSGSPLRLVPAQAPGTCPPCWQESRQSELGDSGLSDTRHTATWQN